MEIDLRLQGGAFEGYWPAAQSKNNRLRWLDYRLATAAPVEANWAAAPAEHWFATARQDEGALALVKGARAEKFMTYDFQAELPLPLVVEGGPDAYDVRSTAGYALHDVVIVAPGKAGRRIGWLDSLPAAHAAKPLAGGNGGGAPVEAMPVQAGAVVAQAVVVGGNGRVVFNTTTVPAVAAPQQPQPVAAPGVAVPVTMSPPIEAPDQWRKQSREELARRLGETGLAPAEVELLLGVYGPALFEADSLVVAWRLPAGVVEELNPLTVRPDPQKTVRMVLVVGRNLDPQIKADLQQYVQRLGSDRYSEREAAEQRLAELGSLAFPVLRQALNNSDPEIAFRAERLLLAQQQSVDLPSGNK